MSLTDQQAVAALLADTSTYHNHKEQMAYVGAVAYIGAAAVLVYSPPKYVPIQWPSLILLGWTAVAGLLYVAWQLRRRDEAAKAAQGYYNLLVGSLPEANRQRFARNPVTRLPKVLILLTMLFWAIAAFCSVVRPSLL